MLQIQPKKAVAAGLVPAFDQTGDRKGRSYNAENRFIDSIIIVLLHVL